MLQFCCTNLRYELYDREMIFVVKMKCLVDGFPLNIVVCII